MFSRLAFRVVAQPQPVRVFFFCSACFLFCVCVCVFFLFFVLRVFVSLQKTMQLTQNMPRRVFFCSAFFVGIFEKKPRLS